MNRWGAIVGAGLTLAIGAGAFVAVSNFGMGQTVAGPVSSPGGVAPSGQILPTVGQGFGLNVPMAGGAGGDAGFYLWTQQVPTDPNGNAWPFCLGLGPPDGGPLICAAAEGFLGLFPQLNQTYEGYGPGVWWPGFIVQSGPANTPAPDAGAFLEGQCLGIGCADWNVGDLHLYATQVHKLQTWWNGPVNGTAPGVDGGTPVGWVDNLGDITMQGAITTDGGAVNAQDGLNVSGAVASITHGETVSSGLSVTGGGQFDGLDAGNLICGYAVVDLLDAGNALVNGTFTANGAASFTDGLTESGGPANFGGQVGAPMFDGGGYGFSGGGFAANVHYCDGGTCTGTPNCLMMQVAGLTQNHDAGVNYLTSGSPTFNLFSPPMCWAQGVGSETANTAPILNPSTSFLGIYVPASATTTYNIWCCG